MKAEEKGVAGLRFDQEMEAAGMRRHEEDRELAELRSEYAAALDSYRDLRDAILDLGGWCDSGYQWDAAPQVIVRRHGELPDVLAAMLDFDGPNALVNELERRKATLLRVHDHLRHAR